MPSARIVYDVDGWAYHHNTLGLQRHAPPGFEVSLGGLDHVADAADVLGDRPVDVVFALPYRRVRLVRDALRRRGWPGRLVTGFAFGWPGDLDHFREAHALSDAVILTNREYYERLGPLPRTAVAPNGVEPGTFRILTPIRERSPRVLWTGSVRYRHLKGYDALLLPLQAALSARGIPCDLHLVDARGEGKRSPTGMAHWYNTGTVYVCASQLEGTPNPALEAAACGCTVVSTRVGNMPELIQDGVNGHLVSGDVESLLRGVEAAIAGYPVLADRMLRSIEAWHWAVRAPRFFEVFCEVLAAGSAGER